MLEILHRNMNYHNVYRILKHTISIIILAAMIGAGIAGYYAYYTNYYIYTAETSYYVYSSQSHMKADNVDITRGYLYLGWKIVPSYIAIITSEDFMINVIEQMNLDISVDDLLSMVTASKYEGSSLFKVSVSGRNPEQVMNIANTIAELVGERKSELGKLGGVKVVSYADLPQTASSSTSVIKNAVSGAATGSVLALFFVLLIGFLNPKLRSVHEFKRIYKYNFTCIVPAFRKKKGYELKKENRDKGREIYNLIRRQILSIDSKKGTVIGFISAEHGEGKSMNCVNSAKSLSYIGKKTLLIDADIYYPDITNSFGLNELKGLTNYIYGNIDEVKTIQDKENDNLHILPAGNMEVHGLDDGKALERITDLIRRLKTDYEYILIDLPEVLKTHDAIALKMLISGYIAVARSGFTTIRNANKFISETKEAEINILGFICNNVKRKNLN